MLTFSGMKIGPGFHVDGGSSDAFGLSAEEVAEERRARGEPTNARTRPRGRHIDSRRSQPVRNPFDEILKSLGLWDRVLEVCKRRGVAPFELGEGSKSKRLHAARKEIYQMLKALDWSNCDVARLFDKDPSTILSALRGK